jgi:hypothetical protein
MTDEERRALLERHHAAMHGMQAGVALDETHDPKNMTPKHLRVGINAAMSDAGGLAKLLIDKGLITEEEYLTAITESAEREHKTYEAAYSKRFGKKITLV